MRPQHKDIAKINAYLSDCPASLREALIAEESAFIEMQQEVAVNYDKNMLGIKLFWAYAKQQALNFKEETDKLSASDPKRQIFQTKETQFERLASSIMHNSIHGFVLAFEKHQPNANASHLKEVYNHLLTSLYWSSYYDVLKKSLKETQAPLDIKTLEKKAWAHFVNGAYGILEKEGLIELEVNLLIQMIATLDHNFQTEINTMAEILSTSYKSSIIPHLHTTKELGTTLLMDRENIEAYSKVSKALYESKLDKLELTELKRLYSLLSDPVYSTEQKAVASLIKEHDPDFDFKTLKSEPKAIDHHAIEAALEETLEQAKVKAPTEPLHPGEELHHLGMRCFKDEAGYLIRNPADSHDTLFESYPKDVQDTFEDGKDASPVYIYRNLEDDKDIIWNAFASKAYKYLPVSRYFMPFSQDCAQPIDFMDTFLKNLNKVKSSVEEKWPAPRKEDESIRDNDIIIQVADSETKKELPLVDALLTPVQTYMTKLNTPSNLQGMTAHARLKGVKTLYHYLNKKEANIQWLNLQIHQQMTCLQSQIQYPFEHSLVEKMKQSDNLKTQLKTYRAALQKTTSTVTLPHAKAITEEQFHTLNHLERLIDYKQKVSSTIKDISLSIVSEIETHHPSLWEKGLLQTIKDILFAPLKYFFIKTGCEANHFSFFRADERFVLESKRTIAKSESPSATSFFERLDSASSLESPGMKEESSVSPSDNPLHLSTPPISMAREHEDEIGVRQAQR